MTSDPARWRDEWAEQFRDALLAPAALQARREFVTELSTCLTKSGNVLWAFGLGPPDFRTALAVATQVAGELVRGAASALEAQNPYSAAVLVRQLVETQYLFWLFSEEPGEASAWLKASVEELRTTYSPASMRKRAQGRFRNEEYWAHCEVGGHPNPKAHYLLPEHRSKPPLDVEANSEAQWADLGQHVEQVWDLFVRCAERGDLAGIPAVSQCIQLASDAIKRWHSGDECSERLPTPLIDALATADSDVQPS